MITGQPSARLLPVIDIMGGQVVHAIKGDRKQYHLLNSRLTPSCHPVTVALAFQRLGLGDLYIADLDALQGGQPDWNSYAGLKEMSVTRWIDAGIRSVEQAQALRQAGADKLIIALETLPTSRLVLEVLSQFGPESIVFSLDLRDGVPVSLTGGWNDAKPEEIAAEVIGMGIRQMILLDVARVGMGQGTGTAGLCQRLRARYPHVTLITGGGIRSREDVAEQAKLGAAYVLAATALHEGLLP